MKTLNRARLLAGGRSWRDAIHMMIVAALVFGYVAIPHAPAAALTTILAADFNTNSNGFAYADDPFGTNQPSYASGARTTTGGYGGSGGLQVTLGGVNATLITGMSGGWSYTFGLAAAESGVSLSFRYKLDQTATYTFDEYGRVLVKVDGVQYGRGAKDYVDHIGGDGSSSQGNSSTYLPTTDWQQVDIYLGDLAEGNHTLILGGLNNKKDAASESTTVTIDDVAVTSGNAAPGASAAQTLASRVSSNQFLAFNEGVAAFHDRCRGSGMGCSSTDYSTNYMNALAWVEGQLQGMGYATNRYSFTYSGNSGTNLCATKTGAVTPLQMYIVSGHLDGRGGGSAFDDDGSGVALVLETARVLAGADVTTGKTVRFCFWDKEEVGLYGAYGYVQDRRSLQGTAAEPTWLGLIQHDTILYDHGAGTTTPAQSAYADLDVEWRAGTAKEADSKALALKWAFAEGQYAPDYPATAYNYSTNTDDTAFQPYVASISVRENRRNLTSGANAEWINPNYHQRTDVEASYAADDIRLGYNGVRTTLGLVAELAGAHTGSLNSPPVANAQTVMTNEDTVVAITLTGSDVDGNPLTYRVVAQPAHGTLSGTAPNLTYTPATNYNGSDSFTFKVNDGTVDSAPATVTITINPANDVPVADPQLIGAICNAPAPITLTGSDVDGNPLTYSVVAQPVHGTLSGSAPNLTYTPAANYSGSDSFIFKVNDGIVDSAPATVTIAVSACNVPALLFADDFENDRGWTVNPLGTDSATDGLWQRAQPQPSDEQGPKQLGDTPSGSCDLVTGALAESAAGTFDVDGGVTSIRSPGIEFPIGQDISLSLMYYFAHTRNASPADYFRVQVVGASTVTVLEIRGTHADLSAAWTPFSISLSGFAGQTVYLLIEAADEGRESLVEAGVDDVSIIAAASSTALLPATFDGGAQGFVYVDDAFRATAQPRYADGAWLPDSGRNGGGLQVNLGGLDTEIVDGMSGGWSYAFPLASAGPVNVTFYYNLAQSPDYETDECSQALVSVDGVLYGLQSADDVGQICGNGNGGIAETTGWRLFSVDLGTLPAGTHTLIIGGYNNRKSYDNESTVVFIDDVVVTAR